MKEINSHPGSTKHESATQTDSRRKFFKKIVGVVLAITLGGGLIGGLEATNNQHSKASVGIHSSKDKISNTHNLNESERTSHTVINDFINFIEESAKTGDVLDPKVVGTSAFPLIYVGEGAISPILFTVYNPKTGVASETYAIYSENKSGINVRDNKLKEELRYFSIDLNAKSSDISSVSINKMGTLVNSNSLAVGIPVSTYRA